MSNVRIFESYRSGALSGIFIFVWLRSAPATTRRQPVPGADRDGEPGCRDQSLIVRPIAMIPYGS